MGCFSTSELGPQPEAKSPINELEHWERGHGHAHKGYCRRPNSTIALALSSLCQPGLMLQRKRIWASSQLKVQLNGPGLTAVAVSLKKKSGQKLCVIHLALCVYSAG